MYLGCDDHSYWIYEGTGSKYGSAVWPAPLLVPAHLPSNNEDPSPIPPHIWLNDAKLIFREDSFDPITRIRRGRMYEKTKDGQPAEWHVPPHPAMPQTSADIDKQGYLKRRLYTFSDLRLSTKLTNLAHPPKVILGCGEAHSQWRILGIERGVSGEDLVTLRAITNMGILPELDSESVPEIGRAKVKQCLETLVDTAYRAGPESVIDRCRDFATALLAAFLSKCDHGALKADLSRLADKMANDKNFKEKAVVINSARTIARLHSRSKPNAEASHGAPPIYEQDAELAIQCAGAIMRDLGFAVL